MWGPRKKVCLSFESVAGRDDALSYLEDNSPPLEVHTPSKTDIIINDAAYQPLSTFLASRNLREGRDFHVHPILNISELSPSEANAIRSGSGRCYPYDQDIDTVRKLAYDVALKLTPF